MPKINGSEDGLEFNVNLTHGSSFIKISDPVLPSSEYDEAVGLHVINSSGDNYTEIKSFVDSAYCISKTGIYGKFGSYYSTIEANSFEDEANVVLISSYNTNNGSYFSRITLDQGSIKLVCNSSNNLSKTGYLTFRCFEQSSTFSLVPDCDLGYKVDLGTSSKKFGTIYADTYAGTVEQALKDGNGNTITSTYIKSIEDTSSLGIKCTKGDNTYSYFQIKESLADAVSQPDSYDEIGTIRLARFELKSNRVSQWGDSAHYFRAGSIYKNSDTVADTLGWWGELKELSCGLALYTDKNDKLFYGYSNEFDGDSFQPQPGTTITFPNSLTGEWKILNAIYDNQFRGNTGDVPLYYWIVMVVKIGSAS